jgi:hypothetical protein
VARGIEIPLIADVAQFVGGMDKAADSVGELADVFDDAGDASERAGDKAGDAMDDAGKESADAADRVRKSWKEALDDVGDTSRKTGDDIGDSTKRGFEKAEDGARDFRDEADSVAKEAATSFDGSAESITDVFRDVAANAFAGFGPAAAGAGVLIAAGIGIAIERLTEYAEKVNEATEAGAEWATSFNTAGLQDRIAGLRDSWEELTAEVRDSREWYELTQERGVTAIEQIAAAARDGVGDVGAFIEAFNITDPVERLRALEDSLATIDRQIGDLGPAWRATLGGPETEQAYLDRRETLRDLRGIVEDQITVQETANDVERAHADTLGLTIEQYRARTEATEAAEEAQESYTQALQDAADPVGVYEELLSDKEAAERRTAEATAAATKSSKDSWEDYAADVSVTTQDLIDTWNRQVRQAREFEQNLATIAESGGQALADELRAKGPEVAGAVAEVIAESGPRKRAQAIRAHARATGEDISGEMGSGIRRRRGRVQDAVDDAVGSVRAPAVDVPVTASTGQAEAAIEAARRRQEARSLTIQVNAQLRAV